MAPPDRKMTLCNVHNPPNMHPGHPLYVLDSCGYVDGHMLYNISVRPEHSTRVLSLLSAEIYNDDGWYDFKQMKQTRDADDNETCYVCGSTRCGRQCLLVYEAEARVSRYHQSHATQKGTLHVPRQTAITSFNTVLRATLVDLGVKDDIPPRTEAQIKELAEACAVMSQMADVLNQSAN